VHIGTAGWSIPREAAGSFAGEGRHLERYARVLNCAEINSSFHRSHTANVYQRWAAQTPPSFRFSVKVPRSITHEGRLRRAREPLQRFLDQASGLGDRLAVLLVQLPPSLAFETRPVRTFFSVLAELFDGSVVCEPRHPSWFTPTADASMAALKVSRVAADPARWPEASRPGGWISAQRDGRGAVLYHRWHGSPRMYWSRYTHQWLTERAEELRQRPAKADCWCIFDNTAGGGAMSNALEFRAMLEA
jgi:uncharacterized protein YecE (DUF72 family)